LRVWIWRAPFLAAEIGVNLSKHKLSFALSLSEDQTPPSSGAAGERH